MVEIFKVSMKLAAEQLGIKYSTAKYILKSYRESEDNGTIRPAPLSLETYEYAISRSLMPFHVLVTILTNTDKQKVGEEPVHSAIEEDLTMIGEQLTNPNDEPNSFEEEVQPIY